MKTIAQKTKLAAIVAFGVTGVFAAAPASAQSYDPGYDEPYYDEGAYDPGYEQGYDQYAYDDSYYGDDAYGYCDAYGCPEDYYDLPVFYGDVFYDNSWLTGPIYYRDWGGRRQFWIRGSWRSSQYRGVRFGPALGRGWYRQNQAFRPGFNRNAYRGNGYRSRGSYGQRSYGQRNFGQRDGGYRQRSFSGNSNFAPNNAQSFRGGSDGFRSQWSNRQGFGQNGLGGGRQRSFQSQQQQPQALAAPQAQQPSFEGRRGWRQRGDDGQGFAARQQRSFGGGDGGGRQRSFHAQQSAPQQVAPQGGGRNWGNRGGDGGGRGDRGGRGRRDRD